MRRYLLLGIVCLCATALSSTTGAGHPPSEPEHGINDSEFWTLWAGDADTTDPTADSDQSALATLAAGSDIPLDTPPRAVETWNRRDLRDLPTTGPTTAIHPTGATQADGTYLKDVGVAIAAISPSTRVRLSETETPHYVAPNGTVRGTVDYRVAVPGDERTPTRRTEWRLQSTAVESVTLLVDGEAVNATDRTTTVALAYTGLEPSTDGTRTLTLRVNVSVGLAERTSRKHVHCVTSNGTRTCRSEWHTETAVHTESVTVSQSRAVSVYDLSISGYRTTYPNGDQGVVVYRNQPWYGVELPSGEVRGVWRYYVARDRSWDRLIVTDANGTRMRHSPVHPVHTVAYPIAPGVVAEPQRRVTVLDTYGRRYQAPELPPNVSLDAISDSYVGSFGIATRVEPAPDGDGTVTAVGLVRGSRTQLPPDRTAELTVTRSRLTLSVIEERPDSVTVRATLRDNATGQPIATASRDGYLSIDGIRVNTTSEGTVTTTVPRQGDTVTARYEPADWWRTTPGYVGDTATVYTGGTVLQYVSVLFAVGVRAGSLLVAAYILDRLTGWGFWPPWRSL